MNRTVVVVTNIPRPYRRALFGVLRPQLDAESFGLRVIYTSDPSKHVRRGAHLETITDPEMESYAHTATFRVSYERVAAIPIGLCSMLRQYRPTCVVVGGFGVDALTVALWSRKANVPYVLWFGGWPGQEGHIGWLRSRTRKRLVKGASAYIAYGTASAEYLETLGALPDRVFCAWNTVDIEGIASAVRRAAERRVELAAKYGLATKNLLFVGSLVERKGLRELVSAALAVNESDSDWRLHLVGDGPLRQELETMVQEAGRSTHFRFHGLRPAGDVAELLSATNGFILPTKREAWGLVINEAMACGIPVAASPQAGATRDLLDDGVTGYVVEPTDIPAMIEVLSRLLAGGPECEQIGRAGAERVRAVASLERAAQGFVAAIRCASNRGLL